MLWFISNLISSVHLSIPLLLILTHKTSFTTFKNYTFTSLNNLFSTFTTLNAHFSVYLLYFYLMEKYEITFRLFECRLELKLFFLIYKRKRNLQFAFLQLFVNFKLCYLGSRFYTHIGKTKKIIKSHLISSIDLSVSLFLYLTLKISFVTCKSYFKSFNLSFCNLRTHFSV